MTRALFPAALGAAALVVAWTYGLLPALPRAEDPFPHAVHERLFPVCEGCHLGVVTGVDADVFPESASCARCHDGTRAPEVTWEPPPRPRVSNLRFSHPEHQLLVERSRESATCQSCHALAPDASRMEVAPATPEGCLECHMHAASAHIAPDADCRVCHIPLTEAGRLPIDRIASFPWPASHDEPDFLLTHAPGTPLERISCGVCHARNSCERCHLNAETLSDITALGHDDRVATLERSRIAEYPVPASHLDTGWMLEHGVVALGDPLSCGTCHGQASCRNCHIDGDRPVPAITALPDPPPDRPQGVDLTGAGDGVHPFDFVNRHGAFAATGALQCSQCHTERYCAECHAGTDSRRFHPDNFTERHALEVFGGGDCQSCHSTETFCRDCHLATGVASQGRRDIAFHTAQPFWILSHGQAARIGLESCASCHRQTDCLACHSSVLGRGINPHGPGFDASRMAARNRVTCRWCHIGDPIGGA